MTDSAWLIDVKAWVKRAAQDDDPAEQMALGVEELLASVPDDEIRRAYDEINAEPGDPLGDFLAAALQQRDVDL